MKNNIKFYWPFGFIVSMLLLTTQCDVFTSVDFVTKNNFVLESSAHEFEVKTKQETEIKLLTINGNKEYFGLGRMYKDTVVYYDDYSVLYKYIGGECVAVVEISGEWFNIIKPGGYSTTTLISIDENNEDCERSLVISIMGDKTKDGDITIRQKKKG